MWNWQLKQWPNFEWDQDKLAHAEKMFIEGSGIVAGAMHHLLDDELQSLSIELISTEAIDSYEIEGEYLNRDSVQSSIRQQLGLKTNKHRATLAENGAAEMGVNLYKTLTDPLSESTLFAWHKMLMRRQKNIEKIGSYRTHSEAMQIVSGADYNRKIYYEAPPSTQVKKEMTSFIEWFSESSPSGKNPLSTIVRAAISHIWFESIHPFKDGNGRIGRAIAEKILAQGCSSPTITVLAKVMLKRRKEYYSSLNAASKSLEITPWILWFASAVIEAQRNTLSYIDFIINKAKLLNRLRDQLNTRQEKALLRMLSEGPEGFKGGLSAANYKSITGSTTATTTRDLYDLVDKGALKKEGERKFTRYFLAMNLKPVATVSIKDILLT